MALLIKDSVITIGSKKVTNGEIASEYKGKINNPIEYLANIGRDLRYHCDATETTVTMAVKVAREVLKRNNLTGKDIDAIVVCSQFPEYTVPNQAILVHNGVEGNEKCITFDLNANCLGMLRGLDVVNRYFNDKEGDIKRALLIGSDYASRHMRSDDLVTFGSLSDGACALLLEYTDNGGEGVIGSASRTISNEAFYSLFPQHGLSAIDKCPSSDIKVSWTDPDTVASVNAITDSFNEVLDKHGLKASDINWFCGSQFAKPFFDGIADSCNIPVEKRIYVGDKFGYTGTSSPFFALTEGMRDGRIKEGDLVFFATVGVGFSISSMIIKM